MVKIKRWKRFRKGSVKYKICAGDREVAVKYLDGVKLGPDRGSMLGILRKPEKRTSN